MKKFIAAILFGFIAMTSMSASARDIEGCDGKFNVFNGVTVKAKKLVWVCFVGGSYRYTYGPVEGDPELVFDVPVDKAELIRHANGDLSMALPNGNYTYTVITPARAKPFLRVEKGNKILTEIDISWDMLEDDIIDYIPMD